MHQLREVQGRAIILRRHWKTTMSSHNCRGGIHVLTNETDHTSGSTVTEVCVTHSTLPSWAKLVINVASLTSEQLSLIEAAETLLKRAGVDFFSYSSPSVVEWWFDQDLQGAQLVMVRRQPT